jgi:hypothetical protein
MPGKIGVLLCERERKRKRKRKRERERRAKKKASSLSSHVFEEKKKKQGLL